MKKLIALILVFVCITCSAAAEFKIPNWENTLIKFNSYGKSFGAPELNREKMVRSGDSVIFQMAGYEVLFIFDKNDNIETAGVRLQNMTAAGDFLLSCMTIVSILGEIDIYSFGMIMFQFAEMKSGREQTIPNTISGDAFTMQAGPAGYIYTFAYANANINE